MQIQVGHASAVALQHVRGGRRQSASAEPGQLFGRVVATTPTSERPAQAHQGTSYQQVDTDHQACDTERGVDPAEPDERQRR
ncbi:hypothetical protein ACWDSD_38570 [Streptomyces spiralis]